MRHGIYASVAVNLMPGSCGIVLNVEKSLIQMKNKIRQWVISYNGKTCCPDIFSAAVKQNYPQIIFIYDNIRFYVEFENRSDYMGARHGAIAEVEVISYNRTKRFKGTASNVEFD